MLGATEKGLKGNLAQQDPQDAEKGCILYPKVRWESRPNGNDSPRHGRGKRGPSFFSMAWVKNVRFGSKADIRLTA